ncbi:unnamed protein product, partial [Adineta steineri]
NLPSLDGFKSQLDVTLTQPVHIDNFIVKVCNIK